MKLFWTAIGLGVTLIAFAFYPSGKKQVPEQEIADLLQQEVTFFDSLVNGPFLYAVDHHDGQPAIQRIFLRTRLAYKRWEWAAEYFNPLLAREINGEPVPEADPVLAADARPEDRNPSRFLVTEPKGLQVIEGILFPQYDSSRSQELKIRLSELRQSTRQYLERFENIGILPGQVFDAAKLEVFRLMTLGISGFDDQLSLHSLDESAAALDGLRTALSKYAGRAGSRTSYDSGMTLLSAAAGYLREHADFNSFDRAAFICRYGNPLTATLTRLVTEWKIPVIRYNRLLRQDAATLFDRNAFDADAYVPADGQPGSAALVRLGKRLFYEPALSASGTRSCASCHRPDHAFANGLKVDSALDGHGLLSRNTPSLLNAALQPGLFYDLRSPNVEAQLQDVLHSAPEMNASLDKALPFFKTDSGYSRMFTAAFPGLPEDTSGIIVALAAYVRSLSQLDSRFDAYMRGDSLSLDKQELEGFNLFMGKARCGTCHYMPLFNGAFPPMYNRIEAEVIGVPASRGGSTIDSDPGRYGIVAASFLQHAFKTPTVRNTARTAPYMHNGVFDDLQQVVDFYNDGGGAGEKIVVPNQTLATDSLHLNTAEKKALIKFMQSLDNR